MCSCVYCSLAFSFLPKYFRVFFFVKKPFFKRADSDWRLFGQKKRAKRVFPFCRKIENWVWKLGLSTVSIYILDTIHCFFSTFNVILMFSVCVVWIDEREPFLKNMFIALLCQKIILFLFFFANPWIAFWRSYIHWFA